MGERLRLNQVESIETTPWKDKPSYLLIRYKNCSGVHTTELIHVGNISVEKYLWYKEKYDDVKRLTAKELKRHLDKL